MKKTIIKLSVFLAVFIVSLIAAGRIMNQGHDNLTMELAEATYPIVTMERNGIAYNQLHGYREAMETAFQRDTVTVLNESRSTDFTVDTYDAILQEFHRGQEHGRQASHRGYACDRL